MPVKFEILCAELLSNLLICPGVGIFKSLEVNLMVGHLNSFLARGGGSLNNNFQKIQMPGGLPGGGGGLLKSRFDWYIIRSKWRLLQCVEVS